MPLHSHPPTCMPVTALLVVSACLFAVTSVAHAHRFVRTHAAHFVHWFYTSHSRDASGIFKGKGQDLVLNFKKSGIPCSGDILYSMPDTLLACHLHSQALLLSSSLWMW